MVLKPCLHNGISTISTAGLLKLEIIPWWSTPWNGTSTTSSKVARNPATSCSGNLRSGWKHLATQRRCERKTYPPWKKTSNDDPKPLQYDPIHWHQKLDHIGIICKWTEILGGCCRGSSNDHKTLIANEQKDKKKTVHQQVTWFHWHIHLHFLK